MMDNKVIQNCFVNPIEVDRFARCVRYGVSEWVNNHTKRHWSLVLFVCKRLRIIKNGVGRKKFGELLIAQCPDVLDKTDTAKTLKFNMDKYEHNNKLEYFHNWEDGYTYKIEYDELVVLFTKEPEPSIGAVEQQPTMSQRLEEFLNECVDQMQFAQIKTSPRYCDFTATFSIEQFKSQKFKDEGRPTHIEVYECIDEIVDVETVLKLSSKYMNDSRIKLFIVSTHGYDNHIVKTAEERNVGLIRVNINQKVNEHNFVLPRLTDNRVLINNYRMMLMGGMEMTEPIVIKDYLYITTSLSDSLEHDHIAVKSNTRVKAPVLSNDEIEDITYQIVKDKAEPYEQLLASLNYTDSKIPRYDFDPYELVKSQGIEIKRKAILPDNQLGLIDMEKKQLFLNQTVDNRLRERFTVAHDDGHYTLHSNLNIPQFYETKSSMYPFGTADQFRLEWQANHFASCLLMPAGIVRELYRIYWQKEYGPGNPSPMRVRRDTKFTGEYHRVVGPISRKLDVSMEAAKWRLCHMELLIAENEQLLKDLV